MSEGRKVHMNITVTGKVQGVGFRFSARTIAQSLGLKGFVKNLYDGSVYLEAEGPDYKIEQLIHWCHQGPNYARVNNVRVEEGEVQGYSYFEITA